MVADSAHFAALLTTHTPSPPNAVIFATTVSSLVVCAVNGSVSCAALSRFAIRRAISATSSRPGNIVARYSIRWASDGSVILKTISPAGSTTTPGTTPPMPRVPESNEVGSACVTGDPGMKPITSTATARHSAAMYTSVAVPRSRRSHLSTDFLHRNHPTHR